jgi:bifunctional DNA-binding transcriptional regulator/antitoxin component of YhaV-PrlF toxin-antitoxin module
MRQSVVHLLLRRVNNTLRVSVPRDYVDRYGLSPGDHVMWIEEQDGVKLKFVRLAELTEMAKNAPAIEPAQ